MADDDEGKVKAQKKHRFDWWENAHSFLSSSMCIIFIKRIWFITQIHGPIRFNIVANWRQCTILFHAFSCFSLACSWDDEQTFGANHYLYRNSICYIREWLDTLMQYGSCRINPFSNYNTPKQTNPCAFCAMKGQIDVELWTVHRQANATKWNSTKHKLKTGHV